MPIKVECSCGRAIHVADEMAGKKGRCPSCGNVLNVPWQQDTFGFADKICPGCGKIWEADAALCTVCGERLDQVKSRSGIMSTVPPKVRVRKQAPRQPPPQDPFKTAPQRTPQAPKIIHNPNSTLRTPATQRRPAPPKTELLDASELPAPPPARDPGPAPIRRATEAEIVRVRDADELQGLTVRWDDAADDAAPPLPANPPRRQAAARKAPGPQFTAEELDALPLVPLSQADEESEERPLADVPTAGDTPPARARGGSDSRSELEVMVREINSEMQRLRQQLEAGRSVERSLEEARKQQRQMLPEAPTLEGARIGVVYRPSHIIGGDFYNFLPIDAQHAGIAIGDISGHGLEAALVVGMLKKALDIRGAGVRSPAQVLKLVNKDITKDLNPATFVTISYAVLDTRARRLTFARAGHTPLILFNPTRERPLSVVNSRGMVMGMDDGPAFEENLQEGSLQLRSGDMLLLFTDGVLEAMNEQREEFGFARIVKALERYGSGDVEYLVGSIERHVDSFRGQMPQKDDMTLLAVKVL